MQIVLFEKWNLPSEPFSHCLPPVTVLSTPTKFPEKQFSSRFWKAADSFNSSAFNPFLFSSSHILFFFSVVIFSRWTKRLLFWILSLPMTVMFSSSLPPLWPLLPISYLPPSGTVIPTIWFYLDLQSVDLTNFFTVTLSVTSLHSWSSLNSICKQDITPVFISLPVLISVFFLIKASKSICLLHTYTNESTGQETKKIPCLIISFALTCPTVNWLSASRGPLMLDISWKWNDSWKWFS